jgi:hypothetical protein
MISQHPNWAPIGRPRSAEEVTQAIGDARRLVVAVEVWMTDR